MTPSDEDLVRRHLAGDRDAFPELLRRHELRVYNIALRMTGRPEDARDATQEAFLSVWKRLGSFRGDAKFSTWLHRIAVNAANDLLRKRSRTPVPAEETIEALAERPGSGDVAGDVAFEVGDVTTVRLPPNVNTPLPVSMRELYPTPTLIVSVPLATTTSERLLRSSRPELSSVNVGAVGPLNDSAI